MAESFLIQTCEKVSDLISALSGLKKTIFFASIFCKVSQDRFLQFITSRTSKWESKILYHVAVCVCFLHLKQIFFNPSWSVMSQSIELKHFIQKERYFQFIYLNRTIFFQQLIKSRFLVIIYEPQKRFIALFLIRLRHKHIISQ